MTAGLEGMGFAQYAGWALFPHAQWLLRAIAQWGFARPAQNPDPTVLEESLKRNIVKSMSEEEKELTMKGDNWRDTVHTFREAFRQGADGYVQDAVLLGSPWDFRLEDVDAKNILLWYGTKDKHAPLKMGQYMADRLKNANLKSYEGETHFTLGENHGKAMLRQLAEAE